MKIVNFIHQNKKYPIELKLLEEHSKYFLHTKNMIIKEEENLSIVDEFDFESNLSEENINEFLKYFKNEKTFCN